MRRLFVIASVAAAILGTGCDSLPLSMGDYSSIIVAASPERWAEAEDLVAPQLEQTVFTVRYEKKFTVTYGDPTDSTWYRVRLLKQQLVIGTDADPWVADALAKADDIPPAPGLTQVEDVWARGQSVTVLLLDETTPTSDLAEVLPTVAALFDAQYRDWALAKMFVTGADTALAHTLMQDAGFSLVVPEVYDHRSSGDSVHVFRNDNPDPSELIREIAVTWQSPIPEGLDGEGILAWRARLVDENYNFPQVISQVVRDGTGPTEDNLAYVVRSVWENPPDAFPAAGPAITKAVLCPAQDRMYLVDAWLFAPGKEKYEYMIQLDQILGSFSCGGATAA